MICNISTWANLQTNSVNADCVVGKRFIRFVFLVIFLFANNFMPMGNYRQLIIHRYRGTYTSRPRAITQHAGPRFGFVRGIRIESCRWREEDVKFNRLNRWKFVINIRAIDPRGDTRNASRSLIHKIFLIFVGPITSGPSTSRCSPSRRRIPNWWPLSDRVDLLK